MLAPPLSVGETQFRVACPAPAIPDKLVGCPGTVCAATETIIVVLPGEPADEVAVTINVEDCDVVEGVPLRTPVLAFKESPIGKDGETLQDVAATPEFVGAKDVIAVPTMALTVEGV